MSVNRKQPGGGGEQLSDARLVWTLALNLLLTVGEVVGGLITGSLVLLADALHNFNDCATQGIALAARRLSRRPADERFTFGYRRAELIGATVNLTILIVVGLYLLYEAVRRFIEPREIQGWAVFGMGLATLAVDILTAWLLWAMTKGTLNMKASFVHKLTDALGSVAVLVGGGLIVWRGWYWVDPALTVLLAGYILVQGVVLLRRTAVILMEGRPDDLDLNRLTEVVREVGGVAGVHHIHVWQLDEQHRALEAHVVLRSRAGPDEVEAVKREVKGRLGTEFGITHATLEVEFPPAGGRADHPTSVVPDEGSGTEGRGGPG